MMISPRVVTYKAGINTSHPTWNGASRTDSDGKLFPRTGRSEAGGRTTFEQHHSPFPSEILSFFLFCWGQVVQSTIISLQFCFSCALQELHFRTGDPFFYRKFGV